MAAKATKKNGNTVIVLLATLSIPLVFFLSFFLIKSFAPAPFSTKPLYYYAIPFSISLLLAGIIPLKFGIDIFWWYADPALVFKVRGIRSIYPNYNQKKLQQMYEKSIKFRAIACILLGLFGLFSILLIWFMTYKMSGVVSALAELTVRFWLK